MFARAWYGMARRSKCSLVAAFYLEKKISKRLKSLREENYDYGYEGGVMLCK